VFDRDGPTGVLFDAVEEKALYAPLMEDDLLEAADIGYRVGDSIAALDVAGGVWVPKADFEHVVGFDPGPVSKFERVEDLKRAALETVCLTIEDLRLSVSTYYGC
jgi:hypothetical protein